MTSTVSYRAFDHRGIEIFVGDFLKSISPHFSSEIVQIVAYDKIKIKTTYNSINENEPKITSHIELYSRFCTKLDKPQHIKINGKDKKIKVKVTKTEPKHKELPFNLSQINKNPSGLDVLRTTILRDRNIMGND